MNVHEEAAAILVKEGWPPAKAAAACAGLKGRHAGYIAGRARKAAGPGTPPPSKPPATPKQEPTQTPKPAKPPTPPKPAKAPRAPTLPAEHDPNTLSTMLRNALQGAFGALEFRQDGNVVALFRKGGIATPVSIALHPEYVIVSGVHHRTGKRDMRPGRLLTDKERIIDDCIGMGMPQK